MRHVIDAVAAQGRNGDTELLHVTKGEVAGLDALAKQAFGKELPRNPKTGIKEASLFQDWFGQDVGTALGVIAPIALGFIPGIGVPAAIAAGAAMGAANQGLGKGGTTESALLGGVMGGIAGYGGAGIADSLAAAASAAPGTIATTGAEAGVASAANPGAFTGGGAGAMFPGSTEAFGSGITESAGQTALQQVAQGASQSSPLLQSINAANTIPAQGMTPAAGSVVDGAFAANLPQSVPMTAAEKMASGWSNITSSPQAFGQFAKENASTAMQAGIGGYGSAINMAQPEPIAIPGEEPEKKYKAEYYQGPSGEIRTRAVPMAQGGEVYGDYDGVEDAATGGLMGFAAGGTPSSGGISTVNVGTRPGNQAAKTGPVLPASFFSKEDYAKATPEERAMMAKLMAAQREMVPSPMRRTGAGYAGGGIASMAKGRYLQGPGDGMSDSIPASIDDKQPARLATGEFVVPADVVSHLGNGDSNAGAKQLHKMMDRARMSRTGTKKQGKQINPRKVMPT